MKKTMFKCIGSIILGIIIGNILFSNRTIFKKENKEDKYYFLQEGVYTNNILKNNMSNLTHKVIEKKDNKIYIYIGITKDIEIAEKLINIYEEKNIKLSIKEKYIRNNELKNNIEQFDLLINASRDVDEILTIEEVVLANYEEIIKDNANDL